MVRVRPEIVRGEQVQTASADGQPYVLWRDRAEIPCGCAVLAGVRLDTMEAALVFTPCDEEGHFEVMGRARELYVVTLEHPREGVEALAVARDVLFAAFNNLENHGG